MKEKFSFTKVGINIIFLIADAPSHGKQYHHGVSDNYLNEIPDKALENLLKEIIDDRTKLILFSLDSSTDKMFTIIKNTLKEKCLVIDNLSTSSFFQTITGTIFSTVH